MEGVVLYLTHPKSKFAGGNMCLCFVGPLLVFVQPAEPKKAAVIISPKNIRCANELNYCTLT